MWAIQLDAEFKLPQSVENLSVLSENSLIEAT